MVTAMTTRDKELFGGACAGIMGEIPYEATEIATVAEEKAKAAAHAVNICRVVLHGVILTSHPEGMKVAGSSGRASLTVEFPTPCDKWIIELGTYKSPTSLDEAAEQGKQHASTDATATNVAVCAIVAGKPSTSEKLSIDVQWHRQIVGGSWHKFPATTYYI